MSALTPVMCITASSAEQLGPKKVRRPLVLLRWCSDAVSFKDVISQLHPACRYAFLIDDHGLVRWRGSGLAEKSEVDGLLRAADQLLNRT